MANRYISRTNSYISRVRNFNKDKKLLSDRDLLIQITKGNKESFGILYQRYMDQIYNFVYYQINHNQQETEDLTEEVFLRAFKIVLEKPQENKNFQSLLFTIARNLIIDRYRTNKEEIDIEDIVVASEEILNPEKTLENSERTKDLSEAIKSLRSNQQEVIILRYILDLTTDEIAKIMGISHNNVRVLQYRALQSLKTIL